MDRFAVMPSLLGSLWDLFLLKRIRGEWIVVDCTNTKSFDFHGIDVYSGATVSGKSILFEFSASSLKNARRIAITKLKMMY